MELDRTEARVMGALVEKRWTTPDAYPLTLNALVAACNQKSNRDPVLELQEFEITGCLMGLRQKGLLMIHEREGGRVRRYGEKLMDELRLSRQEIAILTELLLRGPQTTGELVRRCERIAPMGSQGDVEQLLRDLAGGHYVRLLPRAAGQRYARWEQLLCTQSGLPADADDDDVDAETDAPAVPEHTPPEAVPFAEAHAPRSVMDGRGPVAGVATPTPPDDDLRQALDELRQEVVALRRRVTALEQRTG